MKSHKSGAMERGRRRELEIRPEMRAALSDLSLSQQGRVIFSACERFSNKLGLSNIGVRAFVHVMVLCFYVCLVASQFGGGALSNVRLAFDMCFRLR